MVLIVVIVAAGVPTSVAVMVVIEVGLKVITAGFLVYKKRNYMYCILQKVGVINDYDFWILIRIYYLIIARKNLITVRKDPKIIIYYLIITSKDLIIKRNDLVITRKDLVITRSGSPYRR